MSQRIGDRPTKFLSALRRQNCSLNEALKHARKSTIFHLAWWMKNPRFNRALEKIISQRRQIHALSQTLTRFCAVDQFSQRVGDEKTTTECLRKAGEAKAKRAGGKAKPPRVNPMHPEIGQAEAQRLRDLLN